MRFVWLDGNRATLRHFQMKPHDGFVDTTNLFHIQGAVAEAFAIQDEQIGEGAQQNAIGNVRERG